MVESKCEGVSEERERGLHTKRSSARARTCLTLIGQQAVLAKKRKVRECPGSSTRE